MATNHTLKRMSHWPIVLRAIVSDYKHTHELDWFTAAMMVRRDVLEIARRDPGLVDHRVSGPVPEEDKVS